MTRSTCDQANDCTSTLARACGSGNTQTMRITVCELPHEPGALVSAWRALCQHTAQNSSEFVLLPEFAMVESVWEAELFDAAGWKSAEAWSDAWLQRLAELR